MAFRIGSPSHLGLLWYLLSFRLRWKESKSTAPVIKQYVIGCHLHGCGTQDALPFFEKTSHAQAGASREDHNLFRRRPLLVRCLSYSE